MSSRWGRGIAWSLLASTLALAPPTRAAEPPDSATLHRLQGELNRSGEARVTGERLTATLYGMRLEADGITFREALARRQDSIPEPRIIAWSEIERIDVRPRGSGGGAWIGAAAGLLAGIAWSAAAPPKDDNGFLQWGPTASGVAVGRMLLTTGAGLAIGTAVGRSKLRWRQVFPTAVAQAAR